MWKNFWRSRKQTGRAKSTGEGEKEAERAAESSRRSSPMQEEALRHPGKKAQVKTPHQKSSPLSTVHRQPFMSVEATPTCMGSVDFFHYEDWYSEHCGLGF